MKNKAENSRTGNSRSLDQSYIWKDAAGLITKELGKSVGSERLYVNLDIIPPGAFSATYHSHSYFFAKPAGKNIAHTFYNSGRENLCILDLGTVDPEDTCYYPDEQMYLHKSNGERRTYRADALGNDWCSNPDQTRTTKKGD